MKDNESKFPKLDGGFCDGMGCSGWCFCTAFLAMKEEFQEVFDKPWTNRWDDDANIECEMWEHAWRLGSSNVREYFEPLFDIEKRRNRAIQDATYDERRNLRIQVHQLTRKLEKLENKD